MWQTLSAVLLFSKLIVTGAVSLQPSGDKVYTAVGEPLNLTCTDATSRIIWKENGNVLQSRLGADITQEGSKSTLLITIFEVTKSIQYECTDGSTQASVEVEVIRVDVKPALFEYQKEAYFECKAYPPDSSMKVLYSWERDGVALADQSTPDGKKFTPYDNGTLKFNRLAAIRMDAGEYQCVIKMGSLRPIKKTVALYAEPFAYILKKSHYVKQRETMRVRCCALGYPRPIVTWYRHDDKVQLKFNPKTKDRVAMHLTGSVSTDLTLTEVDFDDAGKFTCVATATSSHFKRKTAKHSASTLVRVIDRLSWMWPLMGILAQIAVLSTVIFISEKKQRADEEFAKLNEPKFSKVEGM